MKHGNQAVKIGFSGLTCFDEGPDEFIGQNGDGSGFSFSSSISKSKLVAWWQQI